MNSLKEYDVSLVRKGRQTTFEERKPKVRTREHIAGYLEWLKEHYPEDFEMMITLSDSAPWLIFPVT